MSRSDRVDEPWKVLGRHGQVGVEDHQHVARGRGEAQAHGVALALAALAQKLRTASGVGGDLALDRGVGVVVRVPLDEDELRSGAHLWRPGEDLGDVAGLVARRHDDRDPRLHGELPRRRTSDEEVAQREELEGPEPHQETVCERRQERDRQRQQNLLPAADEPQSGELEQTLDVLDGQPVLIQGRTREAEKLGDRQWQLPESAVDIENDPGSRRGQREQPFEQPLNIPGIVDQVGENDRVEGAALRLDVERVGLEKAKMRMPGLRLANHLAREVDADTDRRRHRRQKVPTTAADLQHAQAGKDQRAVDALQSAIVGAAQPAPTLAGHRHAIPVCDPARAIAGGSRGAVLPRLFGFAHGAGVPDGIGGKYSPEAAPDRAIS